MQRKGKGSQTKWFNLHFMTLIQLNPGIFSYHISLALSIGILYWIITAVINAMVVLFHFVSIKEGCPSTEVMI